MISEKERYTNVAKKWLEEFLERNYSKTHNIKVIIPSTNISKIETEEIKKYPNYSIMDFYSDLIGILISKKDKNDIGLVLLNRSTNPINVKEIGEMNIYSNIVKPEASFIVSLKGLPNEVSSLLLDEDICSSLLTYENKNIIILRLDWAGKVDKKGTFPREFKDSF